MEVWDSSICRDCNLKPLGWKRRPHNFAYEDKISKSEPWALQRYIRKTRKTQEWTQKGGAHEVDRQPSGVTGAKKREFQGGTGFYVLKFLSHVFIII